MSKEDDFKQFKEDLIKYRNDCIIKLRILRAKSREIDDINSKEKHEIYKEINNMIEKILNLNSSLEIVKIPSELELEERKSIISDFSKIISEINTDDNLLYYGCASIDEVEYYIKTKNIGHINFQSLQESVLKADPGLNSFYPYGAILVFENKERISKYDNIFYDLKHIITIKENVEDLKKFCSDYRYSRSIVITHKDFINMCRVKYEKKERVNLI